jgi:hypothetical protein
MIDHNHELGGNLGVRGTPAIILNNQLLPGAVSYEEISKMIQAARNGDSGKVETKPKANAEPAPTPAEK